MFIRKAERKKAKLRLGLSGAAGSGKTRGALEIATGMGGKIGMIDTESGRGDIYARDYEYDLIRLEAPYSTARYIEAMKMFEEAGYDILIIDSMSHAWNGAGGVVSIVDAGGKGWFSPQGIKAGAEQQAFIDAIITSKMHIICTFRAKTKYEVEKNDRGQNVPRKIGLEPIQKDNVEYELTLFMTLDQNHYGTVTKDNTKMYDQQIIKVDKEMGAHLMRWLDEGVDPKRQFEEVVLPQTIENMQSAETLDDLRTIFTDYYRKYGKDHPEHLEGVIRAKDDQIKRLRPDEIPVPAAIATKGSRYSQKLVQAAQMTGGVV